MPAWWLMTTRRSIAAKFLPHFAGSANDGVPSPAGSGMDLVDGAIHRTLDAGRRPAFLNFPCDHVFQPGDHPVHRVSATNFEIAGGLVLDRAVNIDHLLAVPSPAEHSVKARSFSFAPDQ